MSDCTVLTTAVSRERARRICAIDYETEPATSLLWMFPSERFSANRAFLSIFYRILHLSFTLRSCFHLFSHCFHCFQCNIDP